MKEYLAIKLCGKWISLKGMTDEAHWKLVRITTSPNGIIYGLDGLRYRQDGQTFTLGFRA